MSTQVQALMREAPDGPQARLRALIPQLTDLETRAALHMTNMSLPVSERLAAMEQLVASSDTACELVKAFADLCRLFVLDNEPAKSAEDIQ